MRTSTTWTPYNTTAAPPHLRRRETVVCSNDNNSNNTTSRRETEEEMPVEAPTQPTIRHQHQHNLYNNAFTYSGRIHWKRRFIDTHGHDRNIPPPPGERFDRIYLTFTSLGFTQQDPQRTLNLVKSMVEYQRKRDVDTTAQLVFGHSCIIYVGFAEKSDAERCLQQFPRYLLDCSLSVAPAALCASIIDDLYNLDHGLPYILSLDPSILPARTPLNGDDRYVRDIYDRKYGFNHTTLGQSRPARQMHN